MYITEIVWWGYTAFLVLLLLFMIGFALKIRKKGK